MKNLCMYRRDLHSLPPIRAEQQVDHVVILLTLAAQIAINHLPDRRRPIYLKSA